LIEALYLIGSLALDHFQAGTSDHPAFRGRTDDCDISSMGARPAAKASGRYPTRSGIPFR
jgi:hypothetical protein